MRSRGCFTEDIKGWQEYNAQFDNQPEELKIREDKLKELIDSAVEFTIMQFVTRDDLDYCYITEDNFDNFKKELTERILSYIKEE